MRTPPPLTEKQARVLGLVRGSLEATGRAPSVRELCGKLGVRSTCTVQRHIEALERKGYVRRANGHRCVSLVREQVPTYAELAARVAELEAKLGEAAGNG